MMTVYSWVRKKCIADIIEKILISSVPANICRDFLIVTGDSSLFIFTNILLSDVNFSTIFLCIITFYADLKQSQTKQSQS